MRLTFIPVFVSLTLATQAQTRSTQEKELALGAQLASQVDRTSSPLGLADVDHFIDSLGSRLSAQMPDAEEHWHFKVIKDRTGGLTHEPIALPGGSIYVPAQLLLAVNNEAELAGMMAHAMAHVVQTNKLQQLPASQLSTIPLIFMGPLLNEDEDSLLPRAALPAHRQQELDADQLAVMSMSAAHFDPLSLLDYIERTQPESANEFSTLPLLSTRRGNMQTAIRSMPQAGPYILSTSRFQSIQDEVRSALTSVATASGPRPLPSLNNPSGH